MQARFNRVRKRWILRAHKEYTYRPQVSSRRFYSREGTKEVVAVEAASVSLVQKRYLRISRQIANADWMRGQAAKESNTLIHLTRVNASRRLMLKGIVRRYTSTEFNIIIYYNQGRVTPDITERKSITFYRSQKSIEKKRGEKPLMSSIVSTLPM